MKTSEWILLGCVGVGIYLVYRSINNQLNAVGGAFVNSINGAYNGVANIGSSIYNGGAALANGAVNTGTDVVNAIIPNTYLGDYNLTSSQDTAIQNKAFNTISNNTLNYPNLNTGTVVAPDGSINGQGAFVMPGNGFISNPNMYIRGFNSDGSLPTMQSGSDSLIPGPGLL
jgi:hypothetical protein